MCLQNRKIDFDAYKEEKPKPPDTGLLIRDVQNLMPNSFQLSSILALISKQSTLYWVNNGEWNMHDMLVGLLSITGPGEVSMCTYATSETAARTLARLKASGMITKLNILIDHRVEVRSANSLQLLTATADQLMLKPAHAKVTIIQNANWDLVVIGSANYTENKRYEVGIISTHLDAVAFNLNWFNNSIKDDL